MHSKLSALVHSAERRPGGLGAFDAIVFRHYEHPADSPAAVKSAAQQLAHDDCFVPEVANDEYVAEIP